MNPEQIYQSLKELAEKLEIQVRDQNLRKTGLYVKSGFCIVKGQNLFIMDKHLKVQDKIELLAGFLSEQPLEDIYILPVLRDVLEPVSFSSEKSDDTQSIVSHAGESINGPVDQATDESMEDPN